MKSLALALLLGSAMLAGCGGDDPATLIASARDYMAKRDLNASIIQLKNALQKDPQNAEARYLLGVASLELGDAQGAEIELRKALELGNTSDEVMLALARTYLSKQDYPRLLADFDRKKLASNKNQAELRALMGLVRRSLDQRKEAQLAFEEALALDPENVTAHLGIARSASSEGDFAAAQSRVDAVLARTPESVDAHLLKAQLHVFQNQGEQAEKAYREAVRIAPWKVMPRLGLITHLVRQRSLEDASREMAELQKVAPRDPRSAFARGFVLVEQGKPEQAREAIQQVLKVAPDHVPSLTIAGLAALQIGALAEAESHLRKAVFTAPQATDARRLLAATQLRMGQVEPAMTAIQELLRTSSSADHRVHALAGEAYLAKGDAASAVRHYERAKSLQPESTVVRTRLAQVRFAEGDTGRAITELELASASDPEAHQADLALIAAHLRQRQPDKALEAIVALEKKRPNDPLTHNLRGIALLLKRDQAGAKASFERALQLQPTYMPAVAGLARLDMLEKNSTSARKRFEAVLKLEPKNEQAMLGLAVLLRLEGADPGEIEKLLKQSIAANPGSATAHASLINFYFRNRDSKSALNAAQEANAALPKHTGIVQALGLAQLAAGETRQAIGTFTRLGEMLPNAAEPRLMLARAHLVARQPEEAIKTLQAALRLRPDHAAVQRELVRIYFATGRPEEALKAARAAQAESPGQSHGHVLEAEVYFAQKKFDLAERKYRETLKRFPEPQIAIRTHASMTAAGRQAQADGLAEDWIRQNPKDASVLAYLGAREMRARRYEAAMKRYQTALQRLPDNPLFLNNLAWASHQLKQPAALEYAERAFELAPRNPAVMDTLGMILTDKGETERGLELLGNAAELAPQAYDIRLNFAKALIKAGRKDAARRELEVLAKLDGQGSVQKEATALLAGL